MHFLLSIALVLQIISAVVVIVLVLMQHGKGADRVSSNTRKTVRTTALQTNQLQAS